MKLKQIYLLGDRTTTYAHNHRPCDAELLPFKYTEFQGVTMICKVENEHFHMKKKLKKWMYGNFLFLFLFLYVCTGRLHKAEVSDPSELTSKHTKKTKAKKLGKAG